MEIDLDLRLSAAKNASLYFEKSKKLAKKAKTAREMLKKLEEKLEKKEEKEWVKEQPVKIAGEWFEKFRWFRLSDGRLVIGGRDATLNEIVIKKHTDPNDVVFHAEMAGSPFFVIKTEGKPVSEAELEAVAQATASYSRAWKMRLGLSEVYWVKPDQVSKQAPAGEYIGKGAFMIRGKRNFFRPESKICIGWTGEKVTGGPEVVIKPQSKKYVVITPGYTKPTDIARKIGKWFGVKDLDKIVQFLPAGNSDIIESK